MAGKGRKSRRIGQWLKWPARVLALLVAIPLVLVPVYWVAPPVSVPMLTRYATGQPVMREWRAIETVSDRLKTAVILSEDGQFCRHWGVDVRALQTEVEDFLAGRPARGASTITMQVARNLFLWNARSVVRKALEVPLAIYVDLVLPKSRIFEIYLNIAEWGPSGQFGVEAGAEAAFGKSAEVFTWREASLLAVALPNPRVRLPGSPTPDLAEVAGIVETRAQRYSERTACVHEAPPEL